MISTTKPKLKSIFILGPDIKLPEGYSSDGENGFLLIGDGKRKISSEEILDIKNHYEIDSTTHLHINAHGGVFPYTPHKLPFLPALPKEHSITLLKDKYQYTYILMKIISKLDNNLPMQVHLWSCYGGLAAQEAKFLPKGSCLVAHASENKSLSEGVGTMGVLNINKYSFKNPNPEDNRLDYNEIINNASFGINNASFGTENQCVIGISGSQKIVSFSGVPKNVLDEKTMLEAIDNFRSEIYHLMNSVIIADQNDYLPRVLRWVKQDYRGENKLSNKVFLPETLIPSSLNTDLINSQIHRVLYFALIEDENLFFHHFII